MDQITEKIYLGNHREGSDSELIRRESIRAILCVAGEIEAPHSSEELGVEVLENRYSLFDERERPAS